MAEGFGLSPPTRQQRHDLAAALTDEERSLLLDHAEKAPFCGLLLYKKREGVYCCRLCGLPLFRAGAKFESGTGWPSFTTPFSTDHLQTIEDTPYGMVRAEIVCARCAQAISNTL